MARRLAAVEDALEYQFVKEVTPEVRRNAQISWPSGESALN